MKMYRIKNKTTFKKKMLELDSVTEIANKLKVSKGAVSKWTNGGKPTSPNIKKIMDEYNLSCNELGAEEYEESTETKTFPNRLNELLKENDLKQQDLAQILNVTPSTVSNWLSKGHTDLNTMKRIADFFDVTVLYLIGESDIRNYDVKEIAESLNCSEELIKTLNADTPDEVIKFLGKIIRKEDLGEGYWDLKDTIFGDPIFLQTLKFEADRVISYYKEQKYYDDFEKEFNTVEICSQTLQNPIRFEPEDKAHYVIFKAMSEAFDRYIDKKLLELGIKKEMRRDILIKHVKDTKVSH